jgi:hypothetical protein
MYSRNLSVLSVDEARKVHERYRNDYGVTDLDYKEICNDLATAGVLRVGGGEVSFRQAYTYCYFVAWHLAQRLHANDAAAREEVKGLCKDLYHEDTANVLVFLAHLTTSHVVLEEMTNRAAELFADSKESDFITDVEPINNLYKKAQALILPHGDPQLNKIAIQNDHDEKKAERDSKNLPGREIRLRQSPEEREASNQKVGKVMEMVTATRTIEILGQVLRNAAIGRKVPAMLEITKQVFSLGRRQLNFLFTLAGGKSLETMITSLEEHYRQRMPRAKAEEVVNEVSRHLFNLYAFVGFALVKQVAVAVGDKNLREVFRRLVEGDPNLANRIYKLGIDLETSSRLPTQDVETLNDELSGKSKRPGNKPTFNNLAHMVVRALVVDYLYLNHVPRKQVQELCQKLNIQVPGLVHDQTAKRLPPPKK